MMIFRVISLVVISGALMLLGADALSSLESHSTAGVLDLVSSGSAEGVSSWASGLLPEAANPAVSQIMAAPAWVPLGVVGLILALLFRVRD